MHFLKYFVAIAASTVCAQMSSKQIITSLTSVTTASSNLQVSVNQINILSGPLFLIGQGPFPTIIIGFTNIVNSVTTVVTAIGSPSQHFIKSEQDAVLAAFTNFVKVHQQLLNLVIGKAGVANLIPFVGSPIAAILRSLEAIVDAFAFALIDLCPDVESGFNKQKSSLDITITKSITVYSG